MYEYMRAAGSRQQRNTPEVDEDVEHEGGVDEHVDDFARAERRLAVGVGVCVGVEEFDVEGDVVGREDGGHDDEHEHEPVPEGLEERLVEDRARVQALRLELHLAHLPLAAARLAEHRTRAGQQDHLHTHTSTVLVLYTLRAFCLSLSLMPSSIEHCCTLELSCRELSYRCAGQQLEAPALFESTRTRNNNWENFEA